MAQQITVNPMDVEGAIPGDDPVKKALDDNVAKVMGIIKATGAADVQINTPFGEMTRGQLAVAGTETSGLLIHKWDPGGRKSRSTRRVDPVHGVQALLNHNINATGFAEGVFRGNVTVNPQDVSGPLPGTMRWKRWTPA